MTLNNIIYNEITKNTYYFQNNFNAETIFYCDLMNNFFNNHIESFYEIDNIHNLNFKHKHYDSIEKIAEEVRFNFKLNLMEPINNLTQEMESLGFIIIQNDKLDNFLFVSDKEVNKIINISEKDFYRYRMFLVNFLGKYIFKNKFIQEKDSEDLKFYNEVGKFSMCFLLPELAFIPDFQFLKNTRIDWDLLYELQKKWKVPIKTIFQRARELAIIDFNEYTLKSNNEKAKKQVEVELEKTNLINQYENLLIEDNYKVKLFINNNNISLDFFNKIFNFNLQKNKENKIIYLNFK